MRDANGWSSPPDRQALDRVQSPVYLDSLDVHALEAQHEAHRVGVTGIHEVEGMRTLAAFRRLEAAGQLRLGVLFHPPVASSLGVVVSMQPAHLLTGIPLVDRHWGQRGRGAYAFKSLLMSGAQLVFGSDVPVASIDPHEGIYPALERKAFDGVVGGIAVMQV